MFLILDFTQSFRLALINNGQLINKELKVQIQQFNNIYLQY